MGEKVKVKWEGLEEYVRFLGENPDLEKVDQILDEGQNIIFEDAKRLVPVRTGRLKRSIQKTASRFLFKKVEAGAPYAGFVEFGTRYMSPRPYMRPGLDHAKRHVGKNVRERAFRRKR